MHPLRCLGSWRLAAMGASALAVVLIAGCKDNKPAPPAVRPAVVTYARPVMQQVSDFEDFTGRTEALKTVEVRARVTGYLERFLFEEGLEVKEGDVLFEIDSRPYKATLDQSVAEVAQSQAQLAKAQADFNRAQGTYNREAISRSEFDLAAAAYAEAKAAVGVVEAKRDQSKLNFEWTKVTAPITGQVSRRMVDPGNLVQADVTPLTTIVQTDKMYINFYVDERTLLKLRRLLREGKVQSRGAGRRLMVRAALADEDKENKGEFPHEGYVDFSDNRVDPNTATLTLRAVFENPPVTKAENSKFVYRIMSPGLFARVRLPIGNPYQALLVPEKAIGNNQGKKYVFVIKESTVKDPKTGEERLAQVVQMREVETDTLHGDLRVITKGLSAGERIIIDGLQRVKDGTEVAPKPDKTFGDKGEVAKAEAQEKAALERVKKKAADAEAAKGGVSAPKANPEGTKP